MPMSQEHWVQQFEDAGAWREGHFILTSGLHSPVYFDKMVILSKPWLAKPICKGLAEVIIKKMGQNVTHIVSPAVGAVVEGYEVSNQFYEAGLAVEAFFVERDSKLGEGMHLKRPAFALPANAKVLIVEDVITTSKSVQETIAAVQQQQPQAEIVGIATLLDRSSGKAEGLGYKLAALVKKDIPTYTLDALPPELARIPAIKPGSRPQP